MTKTQTPGLTASGRRAVTFTAFALGSVSYFTFLITILYAVGLVSKLAVPKTIDTGAEYGASAAAFFSLGLLSLLTVLAWHKLA